MAADGRCSSDHKDVLGGLSGARKCWSSGKGKVPAAAAFERAASWVQAGILDDALEDTSFWTYAEKHMRTGAHMTRLEPSFIVIHSLATCTCMLRLCTVVFAQILTNLQEISPWFESRKEELEAGAARQIQVAFKWREKQALKRANPDVRVSWRFLKALLDNGGAQSLGNASVLMHSLEAREEAARKLIMSHEIVLADLINPSSASKLKSKALARQFLVHVSPDAMAHVDGFLREVAHRLLGVRSGMKESSGSYSRYYILDDFIINYAL